MKIKIGLLLFFVFHSAVYSAVFTVENYSGKDITMEIRLDKKWGSTSQVVKIPYGQSRRIDTGIYGVVVNGIAWKDSGWNNYHLDRFAINPLSIGLIIRLFADEYEWVDGSYIKYMEHGQFPEGRGRITKDW